MERHSRSQSSANFSRLCLKSKSIASSSHNSTTNSKKTSKYFTSLAQSKENASVSADMVQKCEETLQNIGNDCPYKNSLTDIDSIPTNTSLNEDIDFKTPKRVSKRNLEKLKLVSKPANNVRKKGRPPKVPKNQMIFTKTSKENVNKEDVNVEHLELAIALSRSLQDNHKKESNENDATSSTTTLYPSTQQKVATIRQTLEQFGVRINTKKVEVQSKRVPIKKRTKTSKYKYITPILLLRTDEDRSKLIAEKVTLVLAQSLPQNISSSEKSQLEEPISNKLKKNWKDDCRIFKLNNIPLDNLKNNDIFYVKSLNISPSTENKCGSLLKDWTKIPGRDKSPLGKHIDEKAPITAVDDDLTNIEPYQCSSKEILKIDNNVDSRNTTENDVLSKTLKNNLQIKSFTCGSISPELFESDDEVMAEICEKVSSQEKMLCSDQEYTSQSLLNLTPQKNKSVHLSPDKEIDDDGNTSSESLLKFTPNKKNKSLISEKSDLDMDIISPILTNNSKNSLFRMSNNRNGIKNKSVLSDLSDDHLFVNDNGICTFESFSNDGTICYDLTHSFDEENNYVSEKKKLNINQTEQNIIPATSPIIQSSSSSSICEIMQKSMNLAEENDKETPTTTRHSKSLNITDYISNMLKEEEIAIMNNSEQGEVEPEKNIKLVENNVFDLTASSTDSSDSNTSFTSDKNNCDFPSKRSKPKNMVSPTKSNKTNNSRFAKHDSFKSTTSSQGSQESIYISDEELNYSCVYATPYIKKNRNSVYEDNVVLEISDEEPNNLDTNFDFTPKTSKDGDLNVSQVLDKYKEIIEFPSHSSAARNGTFDCDQSASEHPRIKNLSSTNTSVLMKSRKSLFDAAKLLDDSFNTVLEDSHLYNKVGNPEAGSSNTPKQAKAENQISKNTQESSTTPKSDIIIKTTNVTPMTNYKDMNTPKIAKELEKFGLKPLKRQRGVQILKHIYESTHPVVGQTTQKDEEFDSNDEHGIIKKIKRNSKGKCTKKSPSPKKTKTFKDNVCNKGEPVETEHRMDYVNTKHKNPEEQIEIIGDLISANETVNDLIFERKHSTKVQSCRVPLHIAWHNLVSSQPELRKNILLYEPLQLEVLYKLLKEQGYKYHIQDLLTFLDRKCITIRTNQHQHKNSRQKRKSVSPRKSK